ncbi:MAG: hypothetical protein R2716_11125 [Microthrixaceae bacterium]
MEATLVNDVRSRNDVALTSMVRALSEGAARSCSCPRRTSRGGSGRVGCRTWNDVLGSTYFYIDGEGLQGCGRLLGGRRPGTGRVVRTPLPPPDEGEGYIESTRSLNSTVGPLTIHAVTPRADVARSVRAQRCSPVVPRHWSSGQRNGG